MTMDVNDYDDFLHTIIDNAKKQRSHLCYSKQQLIQILDRIATEFESNTSDGSHTFNELYHHRAVLFSVIVRMFKNKAWKSRLHSDGTMFDGMFIVGINTPDGCATYHYNIDPYWDMFDCEELERAPKWDGHTPEQALERISKLVPPTTWHNAKTDQPKAAGKYLTIRRVEPYVYYDTMYYSKDLYNVDRFDFAHLRNKPRGTRAGWYTYDDDMTCIQMNVEYWMELPALPDGLKVFNEYEVD